jgi:hypothetical protein
MGGVKGEGLGWQATAYVVSGYRRQPSAADVKIAYGNAPTSAGNGSVGPRW